MGMLQDALLQLSYSSLAAITVVIGGVLIGYIWTPIAVIVGVLNLLLVLVRGSGFSNIGLLWEPPKWLLHQIMVTFTASTDFRAAPYL